MRNLFIFLSIVVIGIALFLFSNTMRCISYSGSTCPGLCFQKTVPCTGEAELVCESKKVCRAPEVNVYVQALNQFFQKLKYKL